MYFAKGITVRVIASFPGPAQLSSLAVWKSVQGEPDIFSHMWMT